MSAAELARKIDVPTHRVTQIVNGTRGITGDTALRLAHFFGTSAQLWRNLQSLYDLRLAQEKAWKSSETAQLKMKDGISIWHTQLNSGGIRCRNRTRAPYDVRRSR
jgi:addiction module HigA family antidote